jgi:tetratricopeptide (TPR) repeat protein/tRNA A-37 threonylcarbamoyl transferase component Bud32
MDFISRDALIAAMHAWVLDKAKPLAQILHDQGVLTADHRTLLEALVQEHLKLHHNDPEQSLAAVSSIRSVRHDLEQIADPDLQASLAVVASAPAAAPESTVDEVKPAGLRYRILRPHAKGGLGEVFVAEDQELHREVALKEIQPEHADNPQSRGRFVLEAEITGGLEHPGIVPVYGLGQYADGRPFYAMRFIKGDNLKEAIRRFHEADKPDRDPSERSLALRQLLRRFVDVCNAVAYAHSRGVLHRDLKPGNIMLGKYGETLLVDWGLAKPVGRPESARKDDERTLRPSSGSGIAATQMGSAIGTPAYMSPEQAAGRVDLLGPASDVYSLGATLYAVLTGQAPFLERDKGEVLEKVRSGDYPRPRQVKPTAPLPLEAICQKAMALTPTDRYPSPLALAADIEHWLADEAVSAHREPMRARLGRWGRRHRPVVAGALVLLLTVTAGLGVGLYFVNAEKNRTEEARKGEETQRQLAEQERNRAIDAAAEAKAVLEFFEDQVLAAARPKDQKGGQGYDVKLADAVKAALPFVDKSFAAQPLIEARLRRTMGISFSYLGDAKTAIEQYKKVRALYARHRGPDHPSTLSSMSNLANSYHAAGRTQEALKLHEETLQLMEAKLGPDHPDTLLTMSNLAISYRAAGRTQEAIKLHEETLQLKKAKLGPDHPHTLNSMNNLANSYAAAGRTQEALKLHQETHQLMKAKLGPDHPDTLATMANLANSYRAAGRTQEALKLQEETLQLKKAKLGPDHPHTLNSMNNLANSYHAAGRTQEAIKLHEETLQLRKAKLGPDHRDTLATMANLANSYRAASRTQEALKLHEETLQLKKAKLGPDHPSTLSSMSNLANSYHAAGRTQEAIKLHEKTLQLMEAKLGPDHPDTLLTMSNLANSYEAADRTQEALKLREETLQLTKAKLGPDHPDTLASMNNLAVSYAAAGRTQEAIKLHEETLRLRKAKLGPDHPDTLESMNNLAVSYAAAGRTQEAIKLREETLQLRKAKLGPDHPDTLLTMSNLANSYEAAGRTQEAIKLHEETLQLRKAKLGPDHPDTLKSMSSLALSYRAAGRTQEALKLREETFQLRKAKVGPDHPDTLESMNALAWSLASFPDVKLADPLRAVDLAVQAVAGDPKKADFRDTLGIARYRAGDWKGAIADLGQALRLRKADDSANSSTGFFLAMASWQVGDKAKAREWFDKSVAWMDQGKQKDDADVKRFRAEAAELLGMKEKR